MSTQQNACTCDTVIIYRSSIKLKNGKVIYAHQFGKRAFPIAVKAKDCFSCLAKEPLKQS